MKRLILTFGLLAAFLTACEPCRHYNRLQVATFGVTGPRKPYGSVANVYRNPGEIKRPYTVTGMLSCEGTIGEEAGILNAMLYRCAKMGGDGILLGVPRVAAEKTNAPDPDDKSSNMNINLSTGWGVLINGHSRAYRCQVIKFSIE